MRKLLSSIITGCLLIAMIFLLTTCAKDYSYEGGTANGTTGGTAVYTFDAAGGICTYNVLNGNYYTDSAFDASNTIELQVWATGAGSYTIATNSGDGFKFSGMGTFTDTGRQTVILVGTGKPTTSGTFNF